MRQVAFPRLRGGAGQNENSQVRQLFDRPRGGAGSLINVGWRQQRYFFINIIYKYLTKYIFIYRHRHEQINSTKSGRWPSQDSEEAQGKTKIRKFVNCSTDHEAERVG